MDIANQLQRLPDAPQALLADEVLAQLDVSVAGGLDEDEVKRRLQTFGPNTIVSRRKARAGGATAPVPEPGGLSARRRGGAGVLFRRVEEGAAIAAVLAVNALIGFVTEIRAARSIEALRALGTRSARVRRDGHTRLIPADELVPGDIVLVEGGDPVAADLRLVEASHLGADESTLTGESVAVDKSPAPVAADARIADRTSMLFKGTSVTRGSGIGVVAATGLATELGRISQLVEEAEPESSPMEKRLARLSGQLVWATIDPDRADRRRRPHHRQGRLPHGRGGDCAGGRGDSRRPADRGDAGARAGHVAHGAAERTHRALVGGRDAGRDHRHPHRQDRHADREPHDGAPLLGAVRRNRSRRAAKRPANGARSPTIRRSRSCWRSPCFATMRRSGESTRMAAAIRWSSRCCAPACLRARTQRAVASRALMVRKHAFDTATKMMATVHRRGEHFLFAVKGAPEAVLNAAQDVVVRGRRRRHGRRDRAGNGCDASRSSAITACACWPVP